MSQIIEVNIADVLLRLEAKMDKLEGKIDHLANELNEVKINGAKLDEKLNSVKSDAKTNFDSLDKRLGNIEFVARSIAGGVIIALLLAFARYLFPNVTL
jgi:predicted nuclease with TOPRIM domain